jgi:class 3 adenylate cyclase
MRCAACGHENREGRKFCAACGVRLAAACPACGTPNEPGEQFCGECGASLVESPKSKAESPRASTGAPAHWRTGSPAAYTPRHLADKILQSKSALEGERKQVTVLFADVKGSMELAEQVDPEEWHRILDRFFQILTDGVHRFEGTVNQYTGDGIRALFGAPIAHEDHAQRACYAALHLLDSLRTYAREVKRAHGLDFATRIGLHSGDVVVGKIGDDLRMDYTAQGHTVGLAQRMESLAEPNTCFVSGATAALVSGYFALDSLGPFRVKGVAEPVAVFTLRGLGAARTRFAASRTARGLTRFVGRDADLRTLEEALAQAQAGHGQVVGVVAEAGAGKSRLCFEFAERCRARGLTVLEGQAVAHGKHLPLLPIMQVFRAYYRIEERDDDATVRQKIAGRLLLLDESFRTALPVLFDFFGVPDPERPAPRMDPDARQRLLFAVLRKLVQGTDPSGRQHVTVIEDLHWMDASSEAFLAEWVEAIGGASGLLVVNFRPEYRGAWMQKSYYRQIPLAPLGPEAIHELLADLLGSDPSTAGLAAAVHARTGGNPFFTEEIVQSLIESGHLRGSRGAYRLVMPIEQLAVPSTVQPVLAARIDRLAEREKRVLQTAAVIGKVFSEPVLARVVETSPEELRAALAALQQAEFLYEQTLYPVAEWAFKHPLTQEVALATQLRERRAGRHAAVARVIEALHAEKLDEQAALLAHHWEEAGEPVVAARWHRRAAERIAATDARTARHHWQRVRDLTADRESDVEAAALASEACYGLLSAGWRLGLSSDEEARIMAAGKLWAARAGSVEQAVRLEAAACVVRTLAGDCEGALRHAFAEEQLVEGAADPLLRAAMGWQRGYVEYNTGPLDVICQRFDELIAAAREHGDLPGLAGGGEPILAAVLELRATLEAETGSVAQAYLIADEALQVARERRLLESEGWACGSLAFIERIDGDVDRAVPRCRRCLEIAEQIGSAFSIAWALDELAGVLAHAGQPESLELAERCVNLAREHNTCLEIEALHLAVLAEACIASGDPVRACSVAEEGFEVVQRRGTWHWGPAVALAHARALRAANAPAAAIGAALDRLEAIAREVRAPNFIPLSTLERAALAERESDGGARLTYLRQALQDFERIGAAFRVSQIRRQLEEAAK